MAVLDVHVGTVVDNTDITRTGLFKVSFSAGDNLFGSKGEWVRYVSPYGNDKAAWMAIPANGSQVLCGNLKLLRGNCLLN